MAEDFDLSAEHIAWVVQSYSFFVMVGVLLGGYVADRLSLKRVFIFGVVLFGLGSCLVAGAGEFGLMLFGRALQGFGGGVFSPLVPILLTRSDRNAPGRILVLWGSLLGLIAAFTPAIYSAALHEFGWSAAFGFFGLLSVASIILVGRARTTEDRSQAPLAFSKSLVVSKDLFLMYCYVFCTYGVVSYYLFRFPLLADQTLADLTKVGTLLSLFWLTFSVIGAVLRRVVDTPRVKLVLFFAPIFICFGCLALFSATEIMLFALSAILLGVGLAFSNAPSTQIILRASPEEGSGQSASLDIAFARLGAVVVVALLAGTNALISFLVIALLCALACFTILSVNILSKRQQS